MVLYLEKQFLNVHNVFHQACVPISFTLNNVFIQILIFKFT